MTLKEWMRANRCKNSEMARAIPAHVVSVAKWRSGRAMPSPWFVRRIMEITGGEVTANDFMLTLQVVPRRGPEPQVNCTARSP